LSGFCTLARKAGNDNFDAVPHAALMPIQRIKRHARKRLIRTLYAAIGVGMVSSLVVAAVIYWFYQAGRFRH